MLKKNYSKTGRSCRVTFEIPSKVKATSASLCGEFNGWSHTAHPMEKRKDGRLSTTVSLEAGKEYQFKYLVDGQEWENDWSADGYVLNGLGTEDSLIRI